MNLTDRALFFLCLPWILPVAVQAQTVRGFVVDPEVQVVIRNVETDRPLDGAQVVLLSQDGADEVARTTTDSNGLFQLQCPGSGAYVLRVTHPSYLPYRTEEIQIDREETVSLEIRLGRDVIPLEPLVVVGRTDSRIAAFHQRRVGGGFATFLTREEIDARGAARTTDLLRGLPGVRIDFVRWGVGPTIEMQGGFGPCEPAIFVDGIQTPQGPGSSLDDFVIPERIEGIEVYSSYSTLPVQYHSGMCGAILIWTRQGGREGSEPWEWKRMLLGFGVALGLILWIT